MSYAGTGMGIRTWQPPPVQAGHQYFLGLLGLGAPISQGSATFDPINAKARAAIAAVNAATSAQLASSAGIEAVRSFQAAYGQGLTVDGRFGTHTRAALLTVIPGATLPGGAAAARTTSYVQPSGGGAPVPVSTGPDELITDSERPAWVVPSLVVGGVVLLASGLLIMRKGTRMRANRLRRNRRSAR